MTKRQLIQNRSISGPRLTLAGAVLLASAVSVPVYLLLSLLNWLVL